jgi:serine/threonine protein kinase
MAKIDYESSEFSSKESDKTEKNDNEIQPVDLKVPINKYVNNEFEEIDLAIKKINLKNNILPFTNPNNKLNENNDEIDPKKNILINIPEVDGDEINLNSDKIIDNKENKESNRNPNIVRQYKVGGTQLTFSNSFKKISDINGIFRGIDDSKHENEMNLNFKNDLNLAPDNKHEEPESPKGLKLSIINEKVEKYYEILKNEGVGSNDTILKVKNKIINEERGMRTVKKSEKAVKEIEILQALSHPNIIKTYEIFEDENNYYIITEYLKGGHVRKEGSSKRINSLISGNYSEKEVSIILHQILRTICYLNSNNMMHR